MTARSLPSQATLQALFEYDRITGLLYWKARDPEMFRAQPRVSKESVCKWWNIRYAGKGAFTLNPNGYMRGMLLGSPVSAHRVIWKIHHGVDPLIIDHINGDKADNRIANLRSVTAKTNAKNQKLPRHNRSGCIGVCLENNHWLAFIMVERKCHRLGTYGSFDAAVNARKEAEKRFGFHKNHGRAA